MVSSAVGMSRSELVRTLERIKRERSDDPVYRELRTAFPKAWPM